MSLGGFFPLRFKNRYLFIHLSVNVGVKKVKEKLSAFAYNIDVMRAECRGVSGRVITHNVLLQWICS